MTTSYCQLLEELLGCREFLMSDNLVIWMKVVVVMLDSWHLWFIKACETTPKGLNHC